MLVKEDLEILEYDLNVFYAEDWSEEKGTTWDEFYTIQPSVYFVTKDTWISNRMYMEAFTLTLEETRAIAPDFPEDEWGSDFFITLEHFISTCRTLPESVKAKFDRLPPIESHVLETEFGPEIKWL